MFVLMLFNNQYMKVDSRIKWYIKLLNFSITNGNMPIITHEYLFKHFFELQESVDDRFFNEFEMKKISKQEFDQVNQYTISDSLFEEIEKDYGSRTKMLVDMFSNSNLKFEDALEKIIVKIIYENNGEKIEGVFNCVDAWESIKRLSDKYQFNLICFSFSAIRKVHGYRETLYSANINGRLLTSNETEEKYKKFISEIENTSIVTFSNKEILAFIGKNRNIPLIKYIDIKPKYEMGICTEAYQLVPETFSNDFYTDLDLLYDCRKYYQENDYLMRHHAYFMDDYRVSRENIRNDPASFILSCKRIASSTSQINLKAMLWDRISVMKKNTTGFSFACAKEYNSNEKVDILFLNYYIFGYLIPDEYMFDLEYWRVRLRCTEELYFYNKNMEYLTNKYGYSLEYLKENGEINRLKHLLEGRDIDQVLINSIMEENKIYEVDYNVLSSRFDIHTGNNETKSFYRNNLLKDKLIFTQFILEKETAAKVKKIKFFPLDDVAGKIKLKKIVFNNSNVVIDDVSREYELNKYQGIDINLNEDYSITSFNLEIYWEYDLKK